jgi:hypothetical protein
VEVIVAEVDLYHRFIRVKMPISMENSFKTRINDYFSQLQKDPQLKLSKFQNDQDASGTKSDSDYLNFTIMMIYDIKQQNLGQEILEQGSMTSIG